MSARRYRVTHVTRYEYDQPLEACYNRGVLRPRDTGHQVVVSSEIEATPTSDQVFEHVDYFGNHTIYLETRSPTTRLSVAARSVVDVDRPGPELSLLNEWTVAEAARQLADTTEPVEFTEFTLPSPLVAISDQVRAYAAAVLAPDRPLGTALAELTSLIHTDFRYVSGSTSVQTTLAQLLQLRKGVCQDFAHLAVGCLRGVGLPARYVSGYLETAPPPGRPKLQGADATHAWAAVLTPLGDWVELDPTNDQFADSAYIVTAWGRDFSDVSPLRGVVFTEAKTSRLSVAVDVEPIIPTEDPSRRAG